MLVRLVKLTTPDTQPLSLSELKAHVRVDHDAEDATLQAQLDAATAIVEERIGRTLSASTWQATYDDFPDDGAPLELPMAAGSVVSVVYDASGAEHALTVDVDYTADTRSNPGRLLCASDDWPAASEVRITFTEAVPLAAKQAILLLAGHLYRDREGEGWPDAVERLILQLRGVMIG